MPQSRSREVALVALFTSVAIVMNLAVSIPAPYADFLYYEVWEVPVVVALLLLGFWGGASVAGLNALVLEAVRPGSLPTGPVYNLFAELSMFLGIAAAIRLGGRRGWGRATVAGVATFAAVLSRTSLMTVVNAVVLPLPFPIGFGSFGVTEAQVPGLLVLIGIFNLTITLYTVPLAFTVGGAIESRTRFFGRRGSL